eukprot:973073_1
MKLFQSEKTEFVAFKERKLQRIRDDRYNVATVNERKDNALNYTRIATEWIIFIGSQQVQEMIKFILLRYQLGVRIQIKKQILLIDTRNGGICDSMNLIDNKHMN